MNAFYRALPIAVLCIGCGSSERGEPDAAFPRLVEADLVVGDDGRSEAFEILVPPATRSLTIVVEGAPGALYGLAELRTAGGVELVELPAGDPGPAMRASYEDEQVGRMPGSLDQSIRLGTFTLVYPYRPDQELPAGTASLTIASDTPGPVHVTALLPEDDDGRTLHLELVVVSDTIEIAEPPPFATELASILAQGEIDLVVDAVRTIEGSDLEQITDFVEPQESPVTQSAQLPGLVDDDGGALHAFVVEQLPPGVGGLSLGTPGPPLPASYYYGVVVRHYADEAEMARVLAHELAHFLALQHVSNRGVSGEIYPDPLDDTRPGEGNLMESGTVLTPDQAFALSRSALLRSR